MGRTRRGSGRSPGPSPRAACAHQSTRAARSDLAQARGQRPRSTDHGADRGHLGQLGTLRPCTICCARCSPSRAAVAARLGVTFPVSLDRRLEAGIAVGDHKTSIAAGSGSRQAARARVHDRGDRGARRAPGRRVPHTSTVHACVQLLDRAASRARDHGNSPTPTARHADLLNGDPPNKVVLRPTLSGRDAWPRRDQPEAAATTIADMGHR